MQNTGHPGKPHCGCVGSPLKGGEFSFRVRIKPAHTVTSLEASTSKLTRPVLSHHFIRTLSGPRPRRVKTARTKTATRFSSRRLGKKKTKRWQRYAPCIPCSAKHAHTSLTLNHGFGKRFRYATFKYWRKTSRNKVARYQF
jgi:hypothetical protein